MLWHDLDHTRPLREPEASLTCGASGVWQLLVYTVTLSATRKPE